MFHLRVCALLIYAIAETYCSALFGLNDRANLDNLQPLKCDRQDVAECFTQAFLEVRPMAVTHHTKPSDPISSQPSPPLKINTPKSLPPPRLDASKGRMMDKLQRDCHNYATYVYCFDMNYQCEETTVAEIAADTYQKQKGRFQPKESFLATYGAVKAQCADACKSNYDWSCRSRMSLANQDNDQALYMELVGQARQIELLIVDKLSGCATFESNIRRWMDFRLAMCSELVLCACQEPRLARALADCGITCRELIRKRSVYYVTANCATKDKSFLILLVVVMLRWIL